MGGESPSWLGYTYILLQLLILHFTIILTLPPETTIIDPEPMFEVELEYHDWLDIPPYAIR